MKLREIEGSFGVAQLPPDADLPPWLNGPGLAAAIRTDDELTIVCRDNRIPPTVTVERGWACFRSIGPFAFDQTGIVASLVNPISAAGIGVFVVCTFDGEHILCPASKFDAVVDILEAEGHVFEVSQTPVRAK